MKKLIICLLISYSCIAQEKEGYINVYMYRYRCNFRNDLRQSADSAFKIMSQLFNSEDFKTSLKELKFPCASYCKTCKESDLITGNDILNLLFIKPEDSLFLVIKQEDGALGKTQPFSTKTIAYFYNIDSDMCNLPFSIGLAVNLCHEYMHHIGFCHTHNPNEVEYRKTKNNNPCEDEKYDADLYINDVAYRVGWIAYDILLDWYKTKRIHL